MGALAPLMICSGAPLIGMPPLYDGVFLAGTADGFPLAGALTEILDFFRVVGCALVGAGVGLFLFDQFIYSPVGGRPSAPAKPVDHPARQNPLVSPSASKPARGRRFIRTQIGVRPHKAESAGDQA